MQFGKLEQLKKGPCTLTLRTITALSHFGHILGIS